MHRGLIEGIADAAEVRDLIMARVKMSRTAGLGDELHAPASTGGGAHAASWTAEHLAVLREMREIAARMAV
jgi:hypothetical protein